MKRSKASTRELKRERERLLKSLIEFRQAIRGAILVRFSTCSRPNCACHEGKRHGPRTYVVASVRGRQRQCYVPKSQVAAVHDAVKQYHKLIHTVDRIAAINRELMRRQALEESHESR